MLIPTDFLLTPFDTPVKPDVRAQKKGKLATSHRYDPLPLLRSRPGGIHGELVV